MMNDLINLIYAIGTIMDSQANPDTTLSVTTSMPARYANYSGAHIASIGLHVLAGSAAIGVGVKQLLAEKGGPKHTQTGRWFALIFSVVIATAVLGLTFFHFRGFLSLLTISAAYSCFAGYRVALLSGSKPRLLDNTVSVLALAGGLILVLSIETVLATSNMPKTPVYIAVGSLSAMCVYDLVRNFLSFQQLQRYWLAEHIYKMIGAWAALASAAAGNVLPQYGAFAQLTPSVMGLIFAIAFIYRYRSPDSLNRAI